MPITQARRVEVKFSMIRTPSSNSAVAKSLLLVAILTGFLPRAAGDGGGSLIAWGENSQGQTLVPENAREGVVAVAPGISHVLALMGDGSLRSWGDDRAGQVSIPLEARTGVISMAAGRAHSLAVTRDHRVLAWGANEFQQIEIPSIAGWGDTFAVAAGANHSLLIRSDGDVEAWGDNREGQATVPVAAYSRVVAVAASGNHNLALRTDGTVVAWGGSNPALGKIPAGALSQVIAVAAGPDCNAALRSTGEVVVWGNPALSGTNVPAGAKKGVVAIAVGDRQVFALKKDGSVLAWGGNDSGQISVPLVPEQGVRSLASAGGYGLAIVTNRVAPPLLPPTLLGQSRALTHQALGVASFTVQATGRNLRYRWKKDGSELPAANGSTLNCGPLRDVDAGTYQAIVENDAGSVTSDPIQLTVSPGEGELLKGAAAQWGFGWTLEAVPDEVRQGVVALGAGTDFNMALRSEGRVMTWNADGIGTPWLKLPPEATTNVLAISVFGRKGLALTSDEKLIRWSDPRETPRTAQSRTVGKVVAIAGDNLVLQQNGAAAWADDFGEDFVVPESAQSDVVAIASSQSFMCALRADRRVVCWKDGTGTEIPVPAGIQGRTVQIGAGNFFGAARLEDGSVVAWGDNRFGQLDIPLEATRGVKEMWVGADGIFVRREDGSIFGWGLNNIGQLQIPSALGSSIRSITPGQFRTLALVEPTPPTVVAGPVSQDLIAGSATELKAQYRGYPLRYQWFRNGIPIAGATAASLNLPNLSAMESGDYTVIASNQLGTASHFIPAVLKVRAGRSSLLVCDHTATQFEPVPVEAQNDIVEFASGLTHRVALNQSGQVFAWGGSNELGQRSIPPGAELGAARIATGANHTLLLGTNGAVVAWGDNRKGQCNVPLEARTGVRSIASVGDTSYAVVGSGRVVVWGDQQFGEGNIPSGALTGVKQVTVVPGRAIALRTDGVAFAWGGKANPTVKIPAEIQGRIRATSLTAYYCYAVLLDDSLVGWEWGQSQLPGPGDYIPGLAAVRANVATISSAIWGGGFDTVFVVRNDGIVDRWRDLGFESSRLPFNRDAVIRSATVGPSVVGLITDTPVTLEWAKQSAGMQVSWSSLLETARLQSTSSLYAQSGWVDVTQPQKEVGGRQTISVPLDSASPIRWFRLTTH